MTDSQPRFVLHVIDSLGNVGGAEQQLVEQLRRFSDRRLRHSVVCLYNTGPSQSRQALVPSTVSLYHLFPTNERKPTRWQTQQRLNSLVRQLQPDLIHCSLPDASLASRIVARRRKLPLIETLVNISHERVRTEGNPSVTPLKLAFHRLLDRATMRSVTRFQAISPAVAESWSRVVGLPQGRMSVIPRGIDLAAFAGIDRKVARRVIRAELSLPESALILLNLGREQPQKGQRFLIEAMSRIVESVPEAVLLIAGSPGLHSQVLRQNVADRGLRATVRFLGRREDIPQLFGASDLFVFPSLYEGLGVSLLEAMAAGLAVITTDRPPMSEVVDNGLTGVLVPPGDPTALAEAVLALAGDPSARQRMGEAARSVVAARFSIASTARQVEQLYSEVLG
jgi:glycosyltransferase involved in cell wall biosynthesis